MITERLAAGRWFRLADPGWSDPLDPTWAGVNGGRWNPPGSWPTLYVNADVATARADVRRFLTGSPVEPEDLDDRTGYQLVEAALPAVTVADGHTRQGLADLGLPDSYPLDADGVEVERTLCQDIERAVHDTGLEGVHARSAASPGLELAWYPRPGQRAHRRRARTFGEWYYI